MNLDASFIQKYNGYINEMHNTIFSCHESYLSVLEKNIVDYEKNIRYLTSALETYKRGKNRGFPKKTKKNSEIQAKIEEQNFLWSYTEQLVSQFKVKFGQIFLHFNATGIEPRRIPTGLSIEKAVGIKDVDMLLPQVAELERKSTDQKFHAISPEIFHKTSAPDTDIYLFVIFNKQTNQKKIQSVVINSSIENRSDILLDRILETKNELLKDWPILEIFVYKDFNFANEIGKYPQI